MCQIIVLFCLICQGNLTGEIKNKVSFTFNDN